MRANQYFLINKTPSDRRVDMAIDAMSGPATPWLKLLLMRCSSLSWDKFTQELLRRFGDAAIAAVRVAKILPKIPPTSNDNTTAIVPSVPTMTAPSVPTMTAPLLSTSPPTTTQQENTLHTSPPNSAKQNYDLHAPENSADVSSPFPLAAMASTNSNDDSQQPPPIQKTCKPFILSRPMPLPVLETTPLLPLSHDSLSPQPPFFPLLQCTVPTVAAKQAKLMVTTSLLSASPNILQIQSPNHSQLRYLVNVAAHKSTPMAVSFPCSLFSSTGAPFSYLVMLRFLHIVGHPLWFDNLATTRKHEFEPPPDQLIGFNFDLRLEGKAVLRVRQLIRIMGERDSLPHEC